MSDSSENPYESPQAETGTIHTLSDKVLTENMLYYLKGVSPWLRFIGIVGFVFLGFMALFILIAAVGMSTALSNVSGLEPLGVLGPGIVIVYIPFLALYFFPILYLFRFGNKIKSYLYSGDQRDLEEAFKNNKSLWVFAGVLVIIFLGMMAMGLLITMIVALVSVF